MIHLMMMPVFTIIQRIFHHHVVSDNAMNNSGMSKRLNTPIKGCPIVQLSHQIFNFTFGLGPGCLLQSLYMAMRGVVFFTL